MLIYKEKRGYEINTKKTKRRQRGKYANLCCSVVRKPRGDQN